MSSPDSLSSASRAFYERSKSKMATSVLLGAAALMLLGFCSSAGGVSNYNRLYADELAGDAADAFEARSAGYGFACFVYLCGFIVILAAAFYVSPVICGTPNEKKILQNPHELEGGYAAYDDRASTVSAGNAASKV